MYCIVLQENIDFAVGTTILVHHVTQKLSLLLSFYFHVVLQPLKTFIQTNFRFKRALRFATLDLEFSGLCVTRHLIS